VYLHGTEVVYLHGIEGSVSPWNRGSVSHGIEGSVSTWNRG